MSGCSGQKVGSPGTSRDHFTSMTTNEEKRAVASKFIGLGFPAILSAQLDVLPTKGKISLDTTRVYKGMSKSDQTQHSFQARLSAGDHLRTVRRSDVVVRFVTNTCRHIHVTVDPHTDIVTFRLQKMPKGVFERKKDEILEGLCKILSPVTALPKLVVNP